MVATHPVFVRRAQPLSRKGAFSRQAPHARMFRNRVFRSQAVLLSQPSASVRCGPFAPRALPRFITTMGPSDFHSGPRRKLCLPSRRWDFSLPDGSPRAHGQSFDARCPLSPRRARRLHTPVASPSTLGFITSGSLAALDSCNEANWGLLALRLASLPRDDSPAGLLRLAVARLHVKRAITWRAPFISLDQPALSGKPKFTEAVELLNPAYVFTRYPDVAGGVPAEMYSRTSVTPMLRKTEVFFTWIKNQLR